MYLCVSDQIAVRFVDVCVSGKIFFHAKDSQLPANWMEFDYDSSGPCAP